MSTENKLTRDPKKVGLSLLLLGVSGFSFYFAWQIFQSGYRNNLWVQRTCGDAVEGMGQETLSFYGGCVVRLQFGIGGAWVLILVGVVLGIIGIVILLSKRN